MPAGRALLGPCPSRTVGSVALVFACRHCGHRTELDGHPPSRCPRCGRRQPSSGWAVPEVSPHAPPARSVAPDPLDTLPVAEVGADPADTSIGRGYDLREELGHGGMGAVYAARQRALERLVAVKTLKRDAAEADDVRRFRAEATVTAYLEHPHIVPVHDLSVAPDGALLLAMKKIEGVTWRELLHPRPGEQEQRSVRWSLDDHLEALAKVCDGVAFAHARGVLHADLKPANVMIGGYGEVLITDWGCAAAFGDQPPAIVPRVSELRTLRGSPAYMAPEIARGEPSRMSPLTDVWLLGGILYEILTGKPPHAGETLEVVLENAARGEVEPPDRRAPTRRLPDELCALAMRALAPDPTRRPQSVLEFGSRVRDYRRHAEAIELAEAAKSQLALARASPEAGDEHYRRAIAFCERAIDMWPEYAAGRNQLAQAQIDYAAYALATRSYQLAHAQAFAAAAHARVSDRHDLRHHAERLADEARRASDGETTRRRHLGLLRAGLAGAAALIIAGLVGGMLAITGEQRKLAEALSAARASEARAEVARWQAESSVRALRGLGPRFLSRARRAWDDSRWHEAAREADAALRVDPELSDAGVLKAAALALSGERELALEEADRWNAHSPELRRIIADATSADTEARLKQLIERDGRAGVARSD